MSSRERLVATNLAAGAMAGAIAKTAIAPLDRAKINFQVGSKPYSWRGAAVFLVDCVRNEGVASLWRGNSATMARIVPYAAVQFAAYEQWRIALGVGDGAQRHPPGLLFVAGALAGVTSQSVTYPLDLARARMAVSVKSTSLRRVLADTLGFGGWRALFRGYWPTAFGVAPYAGVSFFTYDSLKRTFGEDQPMPVKLAFGGIAGALGQTSSYPLDVVRRRMQTAKLDPSGSYGEYSTVAGTLAKIYREEGVRAGFFKGLSMNWLKGPVAVGISFASHDALLRWLRAVC